MSKYFCLPTGLTAFAFVTTALWLPPGISIGQSSVSANQERQGVTIDRELVLVQRTLKDDDDHGFDQKENSTGHSEDGRHAGERGDEHDESSEIRLNDEQRRSAGIVVESITLQPVMNEVEAPGEIHLNRYATHQVTPRIEAQVITRHARLGDKIRTGEPLITLSSVAMSEAQGELLTTENEWQRFKKMGPKVVSELTYQDARIAAQLAHARLLAYGMTEKQVIELASSNNVEQANGRFDLLAPSNGTVIRDDFITGQMVQAGVTLFEITDESQLWVEARLDPTAASQIRMGNPARVLAAGNWIKGQVIQVHHGLDENTRTLAVRLLIPNPDDRLHPGQFVTVSIQTGDADQKGMILPLDAVLRSSDGDWQIYVEHEPGVFEPMEVEVIRQMPGQVQVKGLEPGSRVVTHGAFFVQSELAKSGFAVHNH